MRTTTAGVLVLCLTAGLAAGQEHGAAPQPNGAKAATKAGAAAPAAEAATHDAGKPAAKAPSRSTEGTGKAAGSVKAPSPAEESTAHASPAVKPAAAAGPKKSVIEPPISESDRHAADAAKDAHRAVNHKDASAPEKALRSRVPVDELAVRLQRVLDDEAERKKGAHTGTPATSARTSTSRKAPLPKAPQESPRPVGVTLSWGTASWGSHVTLEWEDDVDPRQPPRQAPSGARLSWGGDPP